MYHLLFLAIGSLEGIVALESTGKPLHHVTVILPQLNKSTETGDDGKFRFTGLPEGQYDIQMAKIRTRTRNVLVMKS